MIQVEMPSVVRTAFGKGPMRRLRAADMTPANLYSGGNTPVALQFDAKVLHKQLLFIHRRNAVITLEIEGDEKAKRFVVIQEMQKDPVSGKLLHVDFLEIDLDAVREFTVPLTFVGTAKGVDLGGDLQVYKNTIVLRGRPLDIPDTVETDITALEQGGAGITYGDLALSESVEMVNNPAVTCVAVI